ncbi:MAG: cbb3-type cytochrome c oxidase subunit I, partial [Chloroflexota bacterium]
MNRSTKGSILSVGLFRGLLYMLVGFLVGALLVSVIRLLTGHPAFFAWDATGNLYFFSEPAWVVGALFGAVAFMLGSGTVSDWLQWANGVDTPAHPTDAFESGWKRYFSATYDHKAIGIQYGFTSLVILGLAGVFALIFRTELAQPGAEQVVSFQTYNTVMSLHGIVMIAGILLGVGAMSNYLVPLMIGANDMAFPRLNAFAYWINVPGAIILLSSIFLGGFDTGWTGYPPLSAKAPLGMDMFFLGVYLVGLSSIFGSINIIVTTVRLRAPGMSFFRMPIFVWSSLATAVIAFSATQLIGLAFQLVLFERLFGMSFFEPTKGGDPILFQHQLESQAD